MRTSIFLFNDTATTEICTLSLHDALPICKKLRKCIMSMQEKQLLISYSPVAHPDQAGSGVWSKRHGKGLFPWPAQQDLRLRSEEHTSELQSRQYLVCRLLLEKKIPSLRWY